MRWVAVGIVLISTTILNIVLVVHLLGILLGVVVRADLVDFIEALGFRQLVDLRTHKGCKSFLGKGVADRLT